MRIISLDPGGTTGIAIYDDKAFDSEDLWRRYSLGPKEHHAELWHELLTEGPFNAVVYENFLYQRRDVDAGVSLELISREYIGIIKLAHQRHPGETSKLVVQSPSIGKDTPGTFWNDKKLRQLGLWVSSEHERDATRHLLYYVSQTLKDRRFINLLH